MRIIVVVEVALGIAVSPISAVFRTATVPATQSTPGTPEVMAGDAAPAAMFHIART